MHEEFKYGTGSAAIATLRTSGFNEDFTLKDGFVWCRSERFGADDLKIISVNRYEGSSNPGDEATIYGLETTTGLKGVLVTADGIYSDSNTVALLQKLHLAKLDRYRNNDELEEK